MKRKLCIILSVLLIIAFAITSSGLASIPVSSIKLNTTSINLFVGKTYALKISLTPENATNKKLTFSSANKKIASVDKNGIIKGIITGKTVVTVTSASNKKAVAKCNVIVIAKLPLMKITLAGNWMGTGTKPQKDGFIVKYAENKFNVDFSFTDVGAMNQDEQFNIKLASGEIPDVFFGSKINDWYKQGIIRPISVDLIKENLAKVWPQVQKYDTSGFALRKRSFEGKLYGVPSLTVSGKISAFTRLYRLDWLENLGLSVPKTLDEMEVVLNAFTNKDPDGNGKRDTYGINMEANKIEVADVFGAFGLLADNWQVKEGKIVWSSTTNEYKTALKLLANWYKAGYINPEFITDSWDTFIAKFADSKIGSYQLNWRWITDIRSDTPVYFLKQKNPKAKIVYADAVKGPSGKSGTFGYSADLGWALVFGKDVKDEKVARYLQIVDYFQGDPNAMNLIIGGSAYDVIDGRIKTKVTDIKQQVQEGMLTSFIYVLQPDHFLTATFGNKGTNSRDTIEQFLKQPQLESAIGGLPLLKAREKGIGNDITKICDQFFFDGITGKINIDKEWDDYLKKLDQAGLKDWTTEATEIYSTLK